MLPCEALQLAAGHDASKLLVALAAATHSSSDSLGWNSNHSAASTVTTSSASSPIHPCAADTALQGSEYSGRMGSAMPSTPANAWNIGIGGAAAFATITDPDIGHQSP